MLRRRVEAAKGVVECRVQKIAKSEKSEKYSCISTSYIPSAVEVCCQNK